MNGIEADLDRALGNTIKTVTANYNVAVTDRIILCNASGQISVILPDPATVSTNRVYTVRNVTTNRVLLGSFGTSPKIDNTAVSSTASSNVFLMYNNSASFVSDGTNWWSFGTGTQLVNNNNQPYVDSSYNFNLAGGGLQVDSGGNITNLSNGFNVIFGTTSGQPTDGKNYGLRIGHSNDSPVGRLWHKAWGGLQSWGWAPTTAARLYATKTANYTLTVTDEFVVFNGSSLTATLPDPTGNAMNGRVFSVKNINASALSVVSAGTSKTIDGAASVTVNQWGGLDLISDGTQWLIRSKI
jgi:hypothetical protein